MSSSQGMGGILKDHALTEGPIPDPGDTGEIVVDRLIGYCRIGSTGAETRVLATPSQIGLLAIVQQYTSDGAITIEVGDDFDGAGNDELVLHLAGDYAIFVSVMAGTDRVWRLVAADSRIIGLPHRPNVVRTEIEDIADGAAMALTADDIAGGIVRSDPTEARNVALPDGADVAAAWNLRSNEGVEWSYVNIDATYALTLTAGTGHTIVGVAVIAAASTGRFITRRVSPAVYETVRLA